MLTHSSRVSGEYQPVTRIGSNVLNACAVILSFTAILAEPEISDATARSGAAPLVVVNRTPKRDRPVPVKQSLPINDLLAPASGRELVDGCESLVSLLSHSPLAQIAGRCLS
jgi:hypothetical protein